MMKKIVLAVTVGLWAGSALARGIYQTPAEFIAETFNGTPPPPQILWIDKALKQDVRRILGHDLNVMRLRYWQRGSRTVWVLEEIGKDEPITVGVVITKGKLELLKVLIFRESRGDEVRYSFFTDQFRDLALDSGGQLTRSIDGISGATLSVRALKKLARLALTLDQQIDSRNDTP